MKKKDTGFGTKIIEGLEEFSEILRQQTSGEKAYYVVSGLEDDELDDSHQKLVGPWGFECVITEPEDRDFDRNLAKLVDKLNKQHDQIVAWKLLAWQLVDVVQDPLTYLQRGSTSDE